MAHTLFPWTMLPTDTSPLCGPSHPHLAPESSVGSVTTYLAGSPSAGAPPGSAWPPAQRLVTKKMASGDQPSWLGGVRLFTRPGCPPNNPARACCPDNGPLLPRTWSSAGHWPSAGPPCARGLMEQQQCSPMGPPGRLPGSQLWGGRSLAPLVLPLPQHRLLKSPPALSRPEAHRDESLSEERGYQGRDPNHPSSLGMQSRSRV